MAMFLARIKRALNLGTKSITANGTYTASSDGYDGYSSVEVNVSGGTLTNLTPSNASPATITSGNDYHATAGGYAIESYNNITPSNSSPVALTSGDIDKMGGNGYAIQSYSSKTPSSTPVSVSSGDIVKMGGRGYLISTYTSAAPSDIDPPSVSLGEIIKITGNSGYLYKTLQSLTNVFNGYITQTNNTGKKAFTQYGIPSATYCSYSNSEITIKLAGKYRIGCYVYDTTSKSQTLYIGGIPYTVANGYTEINDDLSANTIVYFYRSNASGSTYATIIIDKK